MPHDSKFNDVLWISKDQILILLSNDWLLNSKLPPLYFNNSPLLNNNLKPAPLILIGQLNGYYKENDEITFIYYPNKTEKNKHIYLAGNFNHWEAAIGNKQWLLKPIIIDKEELMSITLPWNEIIISNEEILFKFVTENKEWLPIPDDAPNRKLDPHNNANYQINPNITNHNAFILKPDVNYDPSLTYEIIWNEGHYTETNIINDIKLLSTLESTQELGAIISSNTTLFRIFAPRAKSVQVSFYKDSNSNITQLELKRNSDYTWEAVFPANLQGYAYYYTISKTEFSNTPILDPYALACHGPAGPGIIIDRIFIPKINSNFKTPPWTDLIILEAHLRDLIKNTPFANEFEKPIGFLNFEAWVKSDNNYFKSLGINALELLPIQEYERNSPFEYQWGYMPTNYFCPASSYAFGETHLSQITDFQNLVRSLHVQNISVILDVVYNHSGNPNHLFNIDKDYYFTLTKEGDLTNWSGCGNDFHANTPMGKRLIIDSLIYLIQTFDVDGFRFDLAELLGIEVLQEIESALKKVKSSIILIAEPWSFRGHIGHALKPTGFASWNDGYREFIIDYVQGNSNQEALIYFITGSTDYLARFTSQSVNYASSHDDYCWIDRITENEKHDGSNPTVNDIRRTHLMIALLIMSVGIPMLAEGQDFLHSKKGHSNTYLNEYLNAMHYINIAKHSNTHQYFSRLIQFRLSEYGKLIRINKIPSEKYFKFYKHPTSSMLGVLYNADLSLKKSPQLLFIINPHLEENTILLEDIKLKEFIQIGDQERFNSQGLNEALMQWNEEQITLPSLSCGLWIKRIH